MSRKSSENVLALSHEVFAHGAAGVGSQELHGSQLGCSCGDNGGVLHGAGLGQVFHQLCDGGALLTDGNVNTDTILALLVQNGIGCDGGLTGLAVTDDQLTLTTSNGRRTDCRKI